MKVPLFVTWTIGEEEDLRGCIGTFEKRKLSKALGEYALVAAEEDDRFEPIGLEEVEELQVGVSLLVKFKKLKEATDWEVGKHGVELEFVLKGREYSATFLPEVAEES